MGLCLLGNRKLILWQFQDNVAASSSRIHQVKYERGITSSVEQEWVLLFVKQKYSDVSITQFWFYKVWTFHYFSKGTRILPWSFRILQDKGVRIDVRERNDRDWRRRVTVWTIQEPFQSSAAPLQLPHNLQNPIFEAVPKGHMCSHFYPHPECFPLLLFKVQISKVPTHKNSKAKAPLCAEKEPLARKRVKWEEVHDDGRFPKKLQQIRSK